MPGSIYLVEGASVESEVALVERAMGGDGGALDALVRGCRPWVLDLCLRLLRDREAAEDAVQEALTRASASIGQLRDPARFRAWLSRIALNACRMHLRQVSAALEQARTAEIMRTALAEDQSSQGLSEVGQALARLDRDTRRLVLLFYYEGLSHAELAELLSLSAAAVKSRLHRARGRLRKEMLKTMSAEQEARLGVAKEEAWMLRTILLVEREQALQAPIREALQAAGYQVVVLPTGEAALEAARARRGQLLILDKHCGEPHWLEVLALLKTDAWTRENVPVVVLVDRSERDVLLAWGADAAVCLTRPPAPGEIVAFVRKLERAWPEELRPAPWPRE